MREKSLQSISTGTMLGVVLVVFSSAAVCIFAIMFSLMLNTMKDSSLDVIQQMMERSRIVHDFSLYLSDKVQDAVLGFGHDGFSDGEIPAEFDRIIEESVSSDMEILSRGGMDFRIMIIMRDGSTFLFGYSPDNMEDRIREIRNSYWYISNFINPADEPFWTILYSYTDSSVIPELTYGYTLKDNDRNPVGTVLICTSESTLSNIYSEVSDNDNTVYFIDSDGKIISHSNMTLIGMNLYYMPAFFQSYGRNGSSIVHKNATTVLMSVFNDPETGWTVVSEQDMASVFSRITRSLWPVLMVIMVLAAFAIIIAYAFSRIIYKPLQATMDNMVASSSEGFIDIPEMTEYREVRILSGMFNSIVARIHSLLDDIKEEEEAKRRMELSFLQVQINPHFINNTLFNIRCLIDSGNDREAAHIVSSLAKMLNMTMRDPQRFIPLSEELDIIGNYVDLMRYRYYDKVIILECDADDICLGAMIPKMILQPIVENSIFHGFGDQIEELRIHISARKLGDKLIIRCSDNGVGIPPGKIAEIQSPGFLAKRAFNNIGLGNVRDRIHLIYGNDCGLSIDSAEGEGTEIMLELRFYPDDAGGCE